MLDSFWYSSPLLESLHKERGKHESARAGPGRGSTIEEGRPDEMIKLHPLKTPLKSCGDEVKGDEVTGDEFTEGEVTTDEDSMELPPSRRAAVERLVEAGERLKRTLAEPQDVPFLSAAKTYLQALLEVLSGDAAEDFHKLQDTNLRYYWLSIDSYDDMCYKQEKVATAFEEVFKHPRTSAHIEEAVKLLLQVKEKLFQSFIWDPLSKASFGDMLQNISEKLQATGNKAPKKLTTPASQWSVDEDDCMELASLLQKAVRLLEDWENTSWEEVKEMAETNWCGDEVIPEAIGLEAMGDEDEDSVEQSSRRAAVEQLVEAGERLKRTLAEPQDVPFLSTVKTYLQALLGTLTGDAMEDFQKLQDDSRDEIRYRKSRVAAAFKEAMKHVETSSHIGEAVKLLPEVKKKLLNLFERDRQSAKVIGNLLQVISEKLQKPETEKKKDSQAYGWRLDEDACLDLASLLQKTVELLEDWENPSREEVTQMDEDDLNCSENLSQHPELPRVNGSVKFHNSPGRVGKSIITSLTPKLLRLLLLASLLGGKAASPLSATVSVQGRGRTEQGQAYSLTCVVEGLSGTDTTSSYIWYKDGDIIREETKQVLRFTRLTQGDAGNYQCGPKRPPRLGILLSQPFQIREFGGHEVIPKPSLGSMSLPVLHQPFELLCIVFGLPQNHDIHLTYTWFKDSREIPDQTGKSVVFPSLTREDEGVYMCRAKSGHELTTSPDSNLKDLRILMPPIVHMEPATPDDVIRRAAGEELTLTCKVTEAFPWVPAEGYSWSYLPSHQGPWRSLGVRESTLRLGPLTREDSGQYICQARNDLEVFQGQIPPGNTSITVNVVYLENIFLTPDLKVNEGEYVTLTCSVVSNAAALLTWIVDEQEVRHVTANTDHYVLEWAACSDSKTYTCRASNADLPGLERHANTNVQVACNRTVTGPPFPTSSPSNSNQDEEGLSPSSPLPQWLWALLPWALTTVVILLYCCNRKFREKEDCAEVYFLRRMQAVDEEQPA